jgi:hypothetical protein|tara:strand:- start:1009 stop:1590 length:582 start_codon:yes stop_codon:yes gene_type:complete
MKLLTFIQITLFTNSLAFYSYRFITQKLNSIFNKRSYIHQVHYYTDKTNKTKTTTRIYPNRFKSLKRGAGFGIGLSTTLPLFDGLVDLPEKYDTLQSRFDDMITDNIDLIPKDYTDILPCTGKEWSYSMLLHSLNPKYISGISISQDGTYAIIIDNVKKISPTNLHLVVTIPMNINELIHKLIVNNIPFDIIK